MIPHYDIIRYILEFDPNKYHSLINKSFYLICTNINFYIKIWDDNFHYDKTSLEYIDRCIMPIQNWGSDNDKVWYKGVMGDVDSSTVDTQSTDIPLESYLSSRSIMVFSLHVDIDDIRRKLNIENFCYWIGYNNNSELLTYLINAGVELHESIFIGVISNANLEMFILLHEHYKKKNGMILLLQNTIESYADNRIRNLINDMGILDGIIPNIIRPTIFNILNIQYVRGLLVLKKTRKHLDFNDINVSIYFHNLFVFEKFHQECVELLVQNQFYNYLFLVSIIKASLEYGWIELLDSIWNNNTEDFPTDIAKFLNKHTIYLPLKSLKWLETKYTINENIYKHIYKNPQIRNLGAALYCLKHIKKV